MTLLVARVTRAPSQRRWQSAVSATWIAAAIVAGCATDGEPSPTGVAEGSLGVLTVERNVDANASVGASFSRFRGVEADTVLGIVGARIRGEDGCTGDPARPADAQTSAAEIELMDVGTIVVHSEESEVELSPRTFPAVGDMLAGVFYAGEADLPPPELAPAYTFSAQGNAEVGPFEVTVPAIDAPEFVAVDGVAADSGWLLRGRDLEVTWSAAGATSWVEVELTTGAGVAVASCSSDDDGALTLPGTLLARLGSSSARLVVRRVHVRAFDVAGVDRAEVRISATRTFTLTVR